MIELRAGSATDVGLVRSNNQDRLLMADPLYAVADGMGGAAAGEVASATAVNTLRDVFEPISTPAADDLVRSAEAANRAVWDLAEANPEMRGMGTTLVALALVQESHLAIINIGDSRVYALHQGELRQVTEDHNLVAELVAQGRLSEEEAEFHPRRNIMTRALGVDPDVPVDLFLEEAATGDRYLLCSDGLPREVKDDHIASILRRLRDPREAAKELVDEAKRRGGSDNITVVVVDVIDASQKDDPVDATTVVPLAPAEAPQPGPDVPVADSPAKAAKRWAQAGPPRSPPDHSTGRGLCPPSSSGGGWRRRRHCLVRPIGLLRGPARTEHHHFQGPARGRAVVEADRRPHHHHVDQ